MPKFATYPTLYDQCKKLIISDLIGWGYLKPNMIKNGVITWSRDGEKTGSISITTDTMNPESPYIELNYKCNEVPINSRVQLVSIPSNLGKGLIWYFVCPSTGKYCRKLYQGKTYFLHRKAFSDCMYDKQTESRKNRFTGKLFDKWQAANNAHKAIGNKNFTKHYNGRPTKRYLKLLKEIEAGQGICLNSLIMM